MGFSTKYPSILEPSATDDPILKATCASCGAKLKGDYCRKCGEKKIIPERDFSMRKFMNQTMWHFAHFDSKLLRSVVLLFAKPGFLTAEWIAGRRVGYMKPLQLFVVASVLFYFFLPTAMAYFTSVRDLEYGLEHKDHFANTFEFDAAAAIVRKVAAGQFRSTDTEAQVIQLASGRSKSWLFMLIPFWGTLIFLLFQRKMPWLAPQLIFAMHGMTFYLLLDLLIHAVITLLGVGRDYGHYIFLILICSMPVYQVLAVRRVYGDAWGWSVLKGGLIALGFILSVLLYRQIITISVLV